MSSVTPRRPRIAIQGTHGSFSEAAATHHWPDLELVPCREAGDVLAAIHAGTADAGCLPIENSLVGLVVTTYDLLDEAFGDGTLVLGHEIIQPIHHTLLGVSGARLDDIQRVLSHPVALGQCRQWLARHLPHAEPVGVWDTAGAAFTVAEQRQGSLAAIAHRRAADHYGLRPIAERIEDDPTNQTRFFTILRAVDALPVRATAKTSCIVRLRHRPAALAEALGTLGHHGINITALHARPERSTPWAYRFYLDIEGGLAEPHVAAALEELRELAVGLVVLGSYERGMELEH